MTTVSWPAVGTFQPRSCVPWTCRRRVVRHWDTPRAPSLPTRGRDRNSAESARLGVCLCPRYLDLCAVLVHASTTKPVSLLDARRDVSRVTLTTARRNCFVPCQICISVDLDAIDRRSDVKCSEVSQLRAGGYAVDALEGVHK
jgi:hypothetical protein